MVCQTLDLSLRSVLLVLRGVSSENLAGLSISHGIAPADRVVSRALPVDFEGKSARAVCT